MNTDHRRETRLDVDDPEDDFHAVASRPGDGVLKCFSKTLFLF